MPLDRKKIDELEKIVSGKKFEEITEDEMAVITGAVKELADVDPETVTIAAVTLSFCVSAAVGLVSKVKGCL